MSSARESIARTLTVALVVCLVCSIFVAGAAVLLKPLQIENRALDRQRTILAIAGLGDKTLSAAAVRALYNERISAKIVDLSTGQYVEMSDPQQYDALEAAKDPAQSDSIAPAEDIASIKRRERLATVYLVRQDDALEKVILPVRGYGLWSTLYGFIALKNDVNTIVGFGFYQHAETPGLGGEIDNPRWTALWKGKSLFDEQGALAIEVIKGSVDSESARAEHQVDGLAGATLTTNGVNNLLHYWLGASGFGPYLANLKRERG